ncbi:MULTISPECIES: ImmA/IrrE family metallo-endopeptidase [Enterococcus]|uniref:ImmA/IrrE family metallo-endopeptidase n=1 Tax=Enterococcus TaxID=1350 RepID=UPI0034A50A76
MNEAEQLMAQYPDLKYKFEPSMPVQQDGLIIGDTIYLRPGQSTAELTATIAEEIAHYLTSVGDISDLSKPECMKQERKARDIGAVMLVSPTDIINCFEFGCTSVWECAEYLQIPEITFKDAIKWYARKWDGIKTENNYTLLFQPDGTVAVLKSFNNF